MLFVSVPGYSVHRCGKDSYAVALKNGNMGACVMNKEQFDKFVVDHDGQDYRKAAKKVAVGVGATGLVVAGILFRKPIAETAKKAFEAVKDSAAYQKTAEFVKDIFAETKNFAIDIWAKLKNFSVEMFEKAKNFITKK